MEFEHSQYQAEVERRWGKDAYAKSDDWWRAIGPDGRARWQAEAEYGGQAGAEFVRAALLTYLDAAQHSL